MSAPISLRAYVVSGLVSLDTGGNPADSPWSGFLGSDAVLVVACAEGSVFFAAVKGQPWEVFMDLWKHA